MCELGMAIGVALFIVVALVIAIWLIIEVKRLKHKIFAFMLIFAILFLYFSGTFVFKDHEIDFKSVSGIFSSGKLYFNWLFSLSGNFKAMTTYAVKMDWTGNQTG